MTGSIQIIGLGAGSIEQLQLGTYRKLTKHGQPVYVRTIDHPVINTLQEEGVSFIPFDEIYERQNQFGMVYEEITSQLLNKAKEADILYAVPGHPMLAEKTVQLLLKQKDIKVEILNGQSYLDDLFTALKIDPIDGFQFIDATSFTRDQLEYRHHMVFCQVYDSYVASEVKLTLLEDLAPEHPITIVEAVGSDSEEMLTIPLEELDRSVKLSNLTSVYVSPTSQNDLNHQFFRMRQIIAELRGPNGCPWDKKQTHESLRKYLLEESYEFIEAVNKENDEGMIEELGDVLLQVMLHSQIGEDEGFFTINDVIKGLSGKMIRRHPHVFDKVETTSEDKVIENWEKIKQEEKGNVAASLLDGVPKELSGLLKAEELQKRAAKVGFKWEVASSIWEKVSEELEELKEAIDSREEVEIEREFGDVLFAIVNLSSYYKINSEISLQRTNEKFLFRFRFIEQKVKEKGLNIKDLPLEELDRYWNEAKEYELKRK